MTASARSRVSTSPLPRRFGYTRGLAVNDRLMAVRDAAPAGG